jgi:hypothetical protein
LLTIDSGVEKDDENRFLKDAEDTLADVLLDGETEVAKLQTFFEMLSFEIKCVPYQRPRQALKCSATTGFLSVSALAAYDEHGRRM